ncbi:hypothetical protein D3C85_1118380 [compost metagenome]
MLTDLGQLMCILVLRISSQHELPYSIVHFPVVQCFYGFKEAIEPISILKGIVPKSIGYPFKCIKNSNNIFRTGDVVYCAVQIADVSTSSNDPFDKFNNSRLIRSHIGQSMQKIIKQIILLAFELINEF